MTAKDVIIHWLKQDQDWAATKSKHVWFRGNELYEGEMSDGSPRRTIGMIEEHNGKYFVQTNTNYEFGKHIRNYIYEREEYKYQDCYFEFYNTKPGEVLLGAIKKGLFWKTYGGISDYARIDSIVGSIEMNIKVSMNLVEFFGITQQRISEYMADKEYGDILANMLSDSDKKDMFGIVYDSITKMNSKWVKVNDDVLVQCINRSIAERNISTYNREFAGVWASIIK